MSEKKIPGCFKYGCFGCAGLFVVGIGIMLLLSAIQLTARTEPTPEQKEAEHVLPPAPPIPDYLADGPETIEIGGELPQPPPDARAGTLELDLSTGEFRIRPGEPGEPLRVIADYDSSTFELKEELTETDGAWNYKVSFGGRGGFLAMLLRGGGNNAQNRVEIIVPRGHPVKIVGDIGLGESKVDLGGLWIEEFDVEYGPGDHFVEVRERTPFPMNRFVAESSMGEMEIRGLGDASPKEVKVEHGMGDLFLDLQGAWLQDTAIELDFRMGSCRVWVPEKEARVALEGGKPALGEAYLRLPDYSALPTTAPTLTLDVDASMGEVRIEH